MNQFQFPRSLVYGKLSKESIRTEDGFKVADYYLLGEKVIEARVSEQQVIVYETFKGKHLSMTVHKTLEHGVLHWLQTVNFSSNQIFQFLVRETCMLGNIYFSYPNEKGKGMRILYYPAGLIFIFRIPITKENLEAVNTSLSAIPIQKHFYGRYASTIVNQSWEGKFKWENIEILELNVPMADVYDVSKALIEKNIIHPEKKYRMIISDTVEAGFTTAKFFHSKGNDSWKSYGIILRHLAKTL